MADPIEEQRLRTIQREYLDFLDDGVSEQGAITNQGETSVLP
jgi:hypothetical protein